MIARSYQKEQNKDLSNNTYQPISATDSSILVNEESPPSGQQVINDNNQYGFKNPR